MNRAEKETAVAELATELTESEAVFAIDYRGISVPQAAELRAKLRETDTSFRVSKNRLAKLAAAQAGQQGLEEVLTGPTALTFVRGDTAAAAKTITTFAREHDVLTFKGGLMGGAVIDSDHFQAIAKLPSRQVLEAQLVGVVASPLTGLARGLSSMISGLAIALQQVADQGLIGQDTPPPAAEPAAATEEPAAEPAETAAEPDETSKPEPATESEAGDEANETSANSEDEQE
ncbi:MAG TPA: 50S ribosomal protein L10 [Solirubrobacterales bacterium]|nr:50S ribosomal protein L10 [Solirubrobacterales bacterium]